jgi:hypothetical protein
MGWFIPVLCVSFLALVGGCVFSIFSLISHLVRSSTPYKEALAAVRRHEAARAALGTPISEAGWPTNFSISTHGGSGSAEMTLPVKGPKGEGVLLVVATKSGGEWQFDKLVLKVKDSDQRIDLLAEP